MLVRTLRSAFCARVDAQTREMARAELPELCDGRYTDCVFVAHQIDEAVSLADRAGVLSVRAAWISQILTSFFASAPAQAETQPRPLPD